MIGRRVRGGAISTMLDNAGGLGSATVRGNGSESVIVVGNGVREVHGVRVWGVRVLERSYFISVTTIS